MLATADPQRPWATLPRAELLTGLAAEAAAQQAGVASNTPMSGQGQGQLAYRDSQALVSSNQQQRQQPVNSLPNGYAGAVRTYAIRVTSPYASVRFSHRCLVWTRTTVVVLKSRSG